MSKTETNTIPAEVYTQMIHDFATNGVCSTQHIYTNDAMWNYLYQTMQDPQLKRSVLSSKVCSRIFTDTMLQFLTLYVEKARFRLQRNRNEINQISEAAQWSTVKRNEGWRTLIQQLHEEFACDGFERAYFDHAFGKLKLWDDDATWQQLLNEWKHFHEAREVRKKTEFVKERQEQHHRLLQTNLTAAPQFLNENCIETEDFYQTWGLMGGRWNSLEFKRMLQIAHLQRTYPVLNEIAARMGRTINPAGIQKTGAEWGQASPLPHAAQSDIVGVRPGNDLGALLPSELAQYADEELENVFWQKYVTQNLQTFDSCSHMLQACQSLHKENASSKGPMIVCMDHSGSMMGRPQEIALSLTMKLTEMCYKDHRDCYLIAFAQHAQPIEVLRQRTELLRFFERRAQGGTDSRDMLENTSNLLHTHKHYANADVLWITDFRIPLLEPTYLKLMEQMRENGARFYGLQIGIAENRWQQYFNEIFSIKNVKMALI